MNGELRNVTLLRRTLLIVFLNILVAGCMMVSPGVMPEHPIKPSLEMERNPKDEKGICLDEKNTMKLLDYIWKLEEGYE
jgi:predicted rRNA methylase YqxC with S4 and FtsJ domains